MGTDFFLAVIHKRILFLSPISFSTHSEGIHIVEIWCMFVLLKDLGIKRRPHFVPCFLLGELLQHSLASFEMETGRK